jgi:hypothetical protein
MNIVSGPAANARTTGSSTGSTSAKVAAHPCRILPHLLLMFVEAVNAPSGPYLLYRTVDHLISPFMTGYEGNGRQPLPQQYRPAREGARTKAARARACVRRRWRSAEAASAGWRSVDAALGTVDALEWSAVSRGSLIPCFMPDNDFGCAGRWRNALANAGPSVGASSNLRSARRRILRLMPGPGAAQEGHSYEQRGFGGGSSASTARFGQRSWPPAGGESHDRGRGSTLTPSKVLTIATAKSGSKWARFSESAGSK